MPAITHSPEELIGTYQYDEPFFTQVEKAVEEKILAYDPVFGPHLWEHLLKVSGDLELLMIQEGYSLEDAKTAGRAFLLHDADKILSDIENWRLEKEKRIYTDEQIKERRKHANGNSVVVTGIVTALNPDMTQDQAKHLMLIRYLTNYHHEQLDGKGYHGMVIGEDQKILRMATIVDAVDGKKKSKDLTTIFSELNGKKHEGQYDLRLVDAYYRLLANRMVFSLNPAPELANV